MSYLWPVNLFGISDSNKYISQTALGIAKQEHKVDNEICNLNLLIYREVSYLRGNSVIV